MEQTFVKTIQGHQLEFNKQTLPAGYNISTKDVESKVVLLLKKDEKGMWNANDTKHLPGWFNEISTHVHLAIEENETKEKNTLVFNQFGNPL